MRPALLLAATFVTLAAPLLAAPLRLVEERRDRALFEFSVPRFELTPTVGGKSRLLAHGLRPPDPSVHGPLPYASAVISLPPGAPVAVGIVESDVRKFDVQLDLVSVPGRELVELEELGILRGVRTAALRVFPFRYDGQCLEVHDRLLIAVHFGSRPSAKTVTSQPAEAVLFSPFLNTPELTRSRSTDWEAEKVIDVVDWYEPDAPWVKLFIDTDALHRIDRTWFEDRQIDIDGVNPSSFRLFHLGEERPLYVSGSEDGRFDLEDHLLFSGRQRRVGADEPGSPRDHDSIYGRRTTYWLTWGGGEGLRFETRSGAPLNGYPRSDWYSTTSHFEWDAWFQQFENAPDNDRDHWFWKREAIRGNDVDTPGSAVFAADLQAPYQEKEYTARIRVALHGLTPGHRTSLKLNNEEFANGEWEGQVEQIFEGDISSSLLRQGANRVTILAFASETTGRDLTFFNWFAIDYRRRYDAWFGYLAFDEPASSGRLVTVTNLEHATIELFDVTNGIRFVDFAVDSARVDTVIRYTATFEDAPSTDVSYVAADSLSIRTPIGFMDKPSQLRDQGNGADYLIITHPRFAEAASRLAEHRRASGLDVAIALTDDIYDEFAFGLMKRKAIADFIAYTYDSWQRRPVYVLLMGDATYDYRNIINSGNPSFVPTLYYHARGRGHSPSDYHYTLVDGDDLLPDLAIGRLPVESIEQASATVDKIIHYDEGPESGDWRSRVVYAANYHPKEIFSAPSDSLATRYTESFGLTSVRVYSPDNSPLPNLTGRRYLDALNDGALALNFAGHGSAGNMQFVFALQFPDWDYLGHVRNGGRLPFVTALSCLNGMFVNPTVDGLGEVFTTKADGGAIAFVSATAISRVLENNALSDYLYNHFFEQRNLKFGPTLNASKISVLADHSSYTASILTMQLFGDPAQELALPLNPDYEAVRLETSVDELLTNATASLSAIIRNNSRVAGDSVSITVIVRPDAFTVVDTLIHERRQPFAGTDTLQVTWPLTERRGPYTIDLFIDPENTVAELEEGNNSTSLTLEILEPLVPALLIPAANAVVHADTGLTLEASLPPGDDLHPMSAACEFALSTERSFSTAMSSGPVGAVDGHCLFRPLDVADDADYYWRARFVNGASVGSWSETRRFAVADDVVAAGSVLWRQSGTHLADGEIDQVEVSQDGEGLVVSSASSPMRPSSATREDGFTVRGLEGAGVVCTDGTYLYVKRWYNDDSTIYPGTDFFARVGSGYGDTRRDLLYGFLTDSTAAGISATYHSDGFIYNESGRAYELERLSVETGRLDTVEIAAGLLEWKYGRVEDGHSLITSDGRYIYNVSMSTNSGTRTGWGVRVFDPANNWDLVREFASPPTETGFTYEWTDGIIADGERLYFIEFGGERRIRMVDTNDGTFLDEWRSDQDTTRVIGGQYDWVNNKVWLGDLLGSALFRYSGVVRPASGTVRSPAVGPARSWRSVTVESAATSGFSVEVEIEEGVGNWVSANTSLSSGSSSLSPIGASRLRLHAQLDSGAVSPTLAAWQVEYEPQATVEIAGTDAVIDDTGLHLRFALWNRSAVSAEDIELVVETLDNGRFTPFASQHLPLLGRGVSRHVQLDRLALTETGVRLFARLVPSHLELEAPPVEIFLPVGGRPSLVHFGLWPDNHQLIDGDPLVPGQAILVSAPAEFVDAEIDVTIDGEPAAADSILAPGDSTGSESQQLILVRPELSPGTHELAVELRRGTDLLGAGTINLVVTDGLALANLLVYPHPVVNESTSVTFVLSHDADITVELFGVSGRLVRRIGPRPRSAGFTIVEWDGRDDGGRLVANGTYVLRVVADGENGSAEHRRPLVVAR